MDEREKLLEQYDDAAFALMMDEGAEAEGEAFLAQFRAAAEADELPELTDDLDRCFRDTIKREYAGRERKVRFRQFRRAAAKVAVAVFATIGILGTLVMSVEAWRMPVQNFFVSFFEKYAAISTDEEKISNEEEDRLEDICLALGGLLPEDYTQELYSQISGMAFVEYENGTGDVISLDIASDGTYMNVDTENAVVTEMDIYDNKALVIEKTA